MRASIFDFVRYHLGINTSNIQQKPIGDKNVNSSRRKPKRYKRYLPNT